eukprot:3519857-Rhodomonas_salina.2
MCRTKSHASSGHRIRQYLRKADRRARVAEEQGAAIGPGELDLCQHRTVTWEFKNDGESRDGHDTRHIPPAAETRAAAESVLHSHPTVCLPPVVAAHKTSSTGTDRSWMSRQFPRTPTPRIAAPGSGRACVIFDAT